MRSAEKGGVKAHAQIQAFEDTRKWGPEAAQEYGGVLRSGHDRVAKALRRASTTSSARAT